MNDFTPSEKKLGLATRKRISSTIDKDLYDKFDLLSKETSIPKSKLLDKALELLFKEYGRD